MPGLNVHVTNPDLNKLVLIGWMAQLVFPFYYWPVWTEPLQHYEYLALRLLSALFALPLIFAPSLPRITWSRAYLYIAISFVGPAALSLLVGYY